MPPYRTGRCRNAARRLPSSRSRSTRGRTCRATSTSIAPTAAPSRASSSSAPARGRRAPARTRSARGASAAAPSSGRGRGGAAASPPLECPLPPNVDVRDAEDHQEEEELEEAEPPELVEDHCQRIQEDDLDVEEDEQHRREVEADREASRLRSAARDARLEGDRARAPPLPRPLGEHERHRDHRRRNQEREGSVDEKRQPVLEHVLTSPITSRSRGDASRSRYRREAGRKPFSHARGACHKVRSWARPNRLLRWVTMAAIETEVAPVLTITASAAEKIKALLADEEDVSVLRVAIQGGGCSGFQYGLGFDRGATEGDLTFEQHGVTVVVDPYSAPYLSGASVDYVDSIQQSGFAIENPNAVASCGCGHSFQVAEGDAPEDAAGACGSGCSH